MERPAPQETEAETPKHPDEIIRDILKLQNEHDPSCDHGDIILEVKEDSSLVIVSQNGVNLAFGSNIQGALEAAHERLLTEGPHPADLFSQQL